MYTNAATYLPRCAAYDDEVAKLSPRKHPHIRYDGTRTCHDRHASYAIKASLSLVRLAWMNMDAGMSMLPCVMYMEYNMLSQLLETTTTTATTTPSSPYPSICCSRDAPEQSSWRAHPPRSPRECCARRYFQPTGSCSRGTSCRVIIGRSDSTASSTFARRESALITHHCRSYAFWVDSYMACF